VRIEACTFAANLACPVRVHNGASLTIEGCTFDGNGRVDPGVSGGAVQVRGGTVRITDTRFTSNAAGDGGALHADFGAIVTVLASTFASNTAAAHGGALAVNRAHVMLGNGTRLESSNSAHEGQTTWLSYFARGGAIVYALPAPMGSWVPNTYLCERRVQTDACTEHVFGETLSTRPRRVEPSRRALSHSLATCLVCFASRCSAAF
jgi:hypothetical protein